MRLPIPPPGLSGTKDSNIKNVSHLPTSHSGIGLLDEIEGVIQGHRDGHGYVARDDGEGDIYLPPNEPSGLAKEPMPASVNEKLNWRTVWRGRPRYEMSRICKSTDTPQH